MKFNKLLIIYLLSLLIHSCNDENNNGVRVIFPEMTGPMQLTSNSKEHLLASYYGINSFDKSQKHLLVLQTDIKYSLPDENEPAILGLLDIETREFIPVTQTRAWNFQQGCMAHWLGTSPDSLIIYNDIRDSQYVSVIMNVHSKQEVKIIPYPVSAVSPDGKEALSINFSRLRITRPDYGYGGNFQNPREDIAFPDDDGLFLIDLQTGESKQLVSYKQIQDMVPPTGENDIAWFNHTLFSRKGSKIFWLSRQTGGNRRITTSLTVNRDGTDLQRSFPDNWHGSHFDWLNDDELMVTANYQGRQYGHVLFTPGKQDYRRLGNGLLDYDGHGTFSPDEKWMLTDTYPSPGMREQKLFLMDMETEAAISLGRWVQPQEFTGFWRCDLHARWSPEGDMIVFNSTHTGSRQVYLFSLDF